MEVGYKEKRQQQHNKKKRKMAEPDPNNPQGLSKNQLKKLAKKAEKDAKKAEKKGDGDQTNQAPPAADAKPAAAPAKAPAVAKAPVAATPKEPPTWKIGHAKAGDSSTVKVAFASQLFGVSVSTASKSEVKKLAGDGDFFLASTTHPVLCFGASVVGGGGNAMAKALRYGSTTMSPCVPSIDLLVDEWCEWERTVLRTAKNDKQVTAALTYLDAAIANKAGPPGPAVHLVGLMDTTADVVVAVTLHELLEKHSAVAVPPAVDNYRKAHAVALTHAKALAQQWHDASNVSKIVPYNPDNPLLNPVLTAIFQQAALKVVNGDEDLLPDAMVKNCSNAKHGDYQCQSAMPMFAAMKKSGNMPATIKSPKDVAQAIIDHLDPTHLAVIENISIQGPGFIVCSITKSYLQSHLIKWLASGVLPKPPIPQTFECVVDFSSPNIAKEMHVGHLRSTIIGEAVCRVLEFVGHHVHRTNHVGDWGTQFGMLIQYLKEEYPEVGQEADGGELPNITDLTVFYKNAKQRFDESAEFKKTAQTNVVALQSGDKECLKIWKMLCDVSRKEFQKVYNRLDVTLEEKGESFYNDKIPAVIQEFDQAGLVKIEEGGAKCVFVTGHSIPLMLQKSDGGYGYDSTDMAALKYRLQTLKAQRIIVITDFSQGGHFEMCYGAADEIGWLTSGQRLDHIGFGTVMGEDGKRFKTRSGDTVRLVDLLDEAVKRMEDSLRQRITDGKANITEAEVHEVAEAIGYGAVKYFDLRRNPTTNYKFSYDQMLDTKGNTAVYLLYARVRLESICAKAKADHGVDVEELLKAGEVPVLEHPSERNLAKELHLFAEVLETTLDDLFPYHICEYVYNVSIAASDFVTQCKVLGVPEMKSRLLLCHATMVAMRQCFDLLGIRHVKRI
ncbi:Arginine--tRNA ligase [Seminavis robusta]|uniref:arginine--tRNA ligase n=1 Tax=Seminavis robusta TaxID=568900 RepID=A0A9N8HIE6_9STRA|nr:Arginine--tRNA ligase [Seminavis robusta]|eukprot:Sro589_g171830.1 Arginine--tRNA ligase (895) ;mRNA; f:49858-52542